MKQEHHFLALQNMYAAGPINEFYKPTLSVTEGQAIIEIELSRQFHHSAGAVHGSVYFKMLDDAAFFAANSLEQHVFLLTTSFTTYMTQPVTEGTLRAVGKVVNQNGSQFISESVVYNSSGNEVGRGNGIFIRSKLPLEGAAGYGTVNHDA